MLKYTQEDIERFYSKINIIEEGPYKGCWDIDYCRNKGGYTHFTINGHNIESHRFMYLIHHQEEKMINLDVSHNCNNRWCVNPEHLTLETHQKNMEYMILQNRQAKGSQLPQSILNEDLIKEMLDNILCGKLTKVKKIAEIYRISINVIYDIINNNGWTHITKDYNMINIKKIITENHGNLSHQDIRDIRTRLKTGESQRNIAKDYKTHQTVISGIYNRKTYSYVI
jgi:hypothetical protein